MGLENTLIHYEIEQKLTPISLSQEISVFIQLTNPGLKPGFFAEIRVGFLNLKTRVYWVLYFH